MLGFVPQPNLRIKEPSIQANSVFDKCPSRLRLSAFKSVNQMENCQDRVMNCHFGAGKSHHFPDFFSHLLAVAMNFAIGAGRLCETETAFVNPLQGVSLKGSAGIAHALFGSMMRMAIHFDHELNGLLFPSYSFAVGHF